MHFESRYLPSSGYRANRYHLPRPMREDAVLQTRAGVSRASVVNALTKMGRSSAESEDSRLFSVARAAGIPSARTRCPSFVRLTTYERASPFVLRRRSHPYETSRFAKSAMLERSMPVAAPSSVWLGASASATACNTINCRSVSATPALSANRRSAFCAARNNTCSTDASGDSAAVERSCGIGRGQTTLTAF